MGSSVGLGSGAMDGLEVAIEGTGVGDDDGSVDGL